MTPNHKFHCVIYLYHFRGDVDKADLLGSTALHHASRTGQWNCVSFLVNFGANIWKMDNDFHTALNAAALENRTEIVKILDMAQNEQELKNPKVVRQLKEKAMKDAEKNALLYGKLQEKASRELEKQKRQQEKLEGQINSDFKAPTSKGSFVTRLTWKMKGGNTAKLKMAKGGSAAFSDLAGTTTPGKLQRHRNEFTVSEVDESGKRTTKSVHGTVSRTGGQVLYMNSVDIDISGGEPANDSGIRPALTNVFPGASASTPDSGIDSFEDAEEAPGLFNRPTFGKLAFFNQFGPMNLNSGHDADEDLENGRANQNGVDTNDDSLYRNSNGTDSLAASGDGADEQDEEDPLDDDDDDTEYTPVIVFLEACGLHHYAHLFLHGEVDMEALMRLTNQDFEDMGLPIGPRRKLIDAIQNRRIVLTEPKEMYDTPL